MHEYGVRASAAREGSMETVYDWVSLAIFAGLIVLFLQRSTGERAEKDASLLYYLGAGVGCAVANYFGNHGQHIVAIAILVATVAFIIYFLKPFRFRPGA
jgi:uncharacterized membrane protein YjjP (DUF1212 family)